MTGSQALPTTASASTFAMFMASPRGRLLRAAFGATLLGAGLFVLAMPVALAFLAVGLLAITTAALGLCPIAPLWGGHFRGERYCAIKAADRTLDQRS